MQKVKEHEVLSALAKRHAQKDAFFTHVKNGRTQMADKGELAIMDAVAIAKSWAHPIIRGYEVKVERSDFLRDTKWHKYFDMCHEFSFVCPTGIIQPEEVPEQAGLIYYNPDKQSLTTKKKSVYRGISMPVDMLWYIAISQLDSDRHPFFSSNREYFEAWVEDKTERQALGGRRVSDKLRRISEKVQTIERELEREKNSNETARETVVRANAILKPYGVQLSDYSYMHDLERVLSAGGAPNLQHVNQLAQALAKELSEMHERTRQKSESEQ